MAQLRQDLSYTFRRLSKTPGLVVAVVFPIGLGLAANSTIFSMVSRFVLTPPPVGDPQHTAVPEDHRQERVLQQFPLARLHRPARPGKILLRPRRLRRTRARLHRRQR